MTDFDDTEIIEGVYPTAEDAVTFLIADDAKKQAVPRLNDAIGKMVTLSTALAGGTLLFLKDDVCTTWGRLFAGLFFVLALCSSAFGSIPYTARGPHDRDSLNLEFESVCRWKRQAIWTCYGFIILGFFLALVGSLVFAIQHHPAK